MWGVLDTLTDENKNFLRTNTPHGRSPEDVVTIYALGGGLPYRKVKVQEPIGGLSRDGVYAYTPRWFTKIYSQVLHTSQ